MCDGVRETREEKLLKMSIQNLKVGENYAHF